MEDIMILVTGMPGVGKSTFATYLSEKLHIPLVCYDHIKGKEWDLIQDKSKQGLLASSYGKISYGFFWFFTEEIMKSHSPLIVEYFFHPMQESILSSLINSYNYKTIIVHFDCDIKVAYKRCLLRNKSSERHPGLRLDDIDFETFKKGVQPNRDFRFGEHTIFVNTNDFDNVSYDDIIGQINNLHLKFNQQVIV
jgi:deoxyadenosine/deoxycytidine kinase